MHTPAPGKDDLVSAPSAQRWLSQTAQSAGEEMGLREREKVLNNSKATKGFSFCCFAALALASQGAKEFKRNLNNLRQFQVDLEEK